MRVAIRKKTRKTIFSVIKKTFKGFGEHKIMKLSASLAYTTIFSMAPMLVMLLFLCSIFLKREAIEGTVYSQIKDFVGPESALQVQSMIKTSTQAAGTSFAGIVSILALLIAATSLFAEIQDSINTIWGVRPKKTAGIKYFLKSRLLSFGVIGSLGFLLLVTLGITSAIDVVADTLTRNFSTTAVVFLYILNILITLCIVTVLFGVIFKVLPDADIEWKQIRIAAFVTAILFMIGKFLISLYISKTNVGSTFGAAGSLVVLLVWVYYSSVILYLGAEFAKQDALAFGGTIRPSKYAETVQQVEVATDQPTLQHAEKEKEVVKDAQAVAEEVVQKAVKEKEEIITEAHSDKADIIADAHQCKENIIEEAKKKT